MIMIRHLTAWISNHVQDVHENPNSQRQIEYIYTGFLRSLRQYRDTLTQTLKSHRQQLTWSSPGIHFVFAMKMKYRKLISSIHN